MESTPNDADADAAPPAADAACTHRWVLADTTKGDTQGTCRLCGVVRTFTDARRTWSRGRSFQPRSPKPPPG